MLRSTLLVFAGLSLVVVSCSKRPEQYFESGNNYFQNKQYREAIVEYRNALQGNPRSAQARLKLAESYIAVGEPASALPEYVRAADLLPGDEAVQLAAATLLLVARRYDESTARADAVLRRNPRNAKALILKGDALAMLENLDEAVKQIGQAILLDPDAAPGYVDLGLVQKRRGDLIAAEQAFKQAIEVDPKSVKAHLALANLYLQTSRAPDAEAELQAARTLKPEDVLANEALAVFYVSTNRAAEAEPYLKAIEATTREVGASLMLADYYAATKRNDEAVRVLTRVAVRSDGFAPASTRLAALQYLTGQRGEAHGTIDRVLAKEPKNEAALMAKARLLMQDGRPDEALGRAKAAVASNPGSVPAQYLLGTIYSIENNVEEAAKAFNEVLKSNPRAVAAQLQLSRLELGKGPAGASSALEYAQQAIAVDPANPLARLMLVRSLIARGDLPRAETEVGSLARQYPNVAAVHSTIGTLHLAKNELQPARQSFERALQLDAASIEAIAGLVSVDLKSGRVADARSRMEARLAKAPADTNLLVLAGRTYVAIGDLSKAEQALQRSIELAPSNLQSYMMLAQVYVSEHKLDEAKTRLEEMAKRDPKAVGAHTMIAMILQLQGKTAEAQKRYERALEMDQRAPVAANNLAWMYAEGAGNLDVALQLARVAKAALPDAPEVNDTLGWVYCKKNLPSLALPPLREAVAKDPKNATYQYHLGVAYAKAGDLVNAKLALGASVKLSIGSDMAVAARQTLDSLR